MAGLGGLLPSGLDRTKWLLAKVQRTRRNGAVLTSASYDWMTGVPWGPVKKSGLPRLERSVTFRTVSPATDQTITR